MRAAVLIMLALMIAPPAHSAVLQSREAITLAGPMVADISQSRIQIHSGFNGTQLLIFGARNAGGDLVIAVRGPSTNLRLRRKERIAGMWMHVEQQKYHNLPLFYAITSTRPLEDIVPAAMRQQLGLGEAPVIAASNRSGATLFHQALQTTLNDMGHWQEPFARISYFGESLFKARLDLPSSLPRGDYSVEVYLFDRGTLIALQSIPLRAFKTGIDARIYDEAKHHPWLYGISAILMALAGGWLAHRLFHK